jgi:hypothetical protein
MHGYADFKSHVTRRDEKGLFGIPFNRLLASGLGGGLIATLTKIPWPDLSVGLGIAGALALLVLTAPRGGIPRWKVLVYDWRWRLLSAAALAPTGLPGKIFQVPADVLDIDGDKLFGAEDNSAPRTELTDWVSYARLGDVQSGEGLVLKKSPDLRRPSPAEGA